MADNMNDFPPDVVEAVKAHLERTRREASSAEVLGQSKQKPTMVIGQFDEPVYTPVEEHLGGADPQSVPAIVDDYRDVAVAGTEQDDGKLASEASKQAVTRQQKAAENPVKPPAPEDGSLNLNDHVNFPHPEQPLGPEVMMKNKSFFQPDEAPPPESIAHEELYPVDEANADVKKSKKKDQ